MRSRISKSSTTIQIKKCSSKRPKHTLLPRCETISTIRHRCQTWVRVRSRWRVRTPRPLSRRIQNKCRSSRRWITARMHRKDFALIRLLPLRVLRWSGLRRRGRKTVEGCTISRKTPNDLGARLGIRQLRPAAVSPDFVPVTPTRPRRQCEELLQFLEGNDE